MQRPAKPRTSVRFRPQPPVLSTKFARVAKLVDARDLKSLGLILRAGSSPAPGTKLDDWPFSHPEVTFLDPVCCRRQDPKYASLFKTWTLTKIRAFPQIR